MKKLLNVFLIISFFALSSHYALAASGVSTQVATNIMQNTATLNGNITDTTGIVTRGFLYGLTAGSPSLADYAGITTETAPCIEYNGPRGACSAWGSFANGAYTGELSSLSPNTTYYFRSFAATGAGSGEIPMIPIYEYGEEQTFTTTPRLFTQSATNITTTTAILNGNITDTTGFVTRGFEYGLASGAYTESITEDVPCTNFDMMRGCLAWGSFANGAYTGELSSLSPNTTYYFRSFAATGGLEITTYEYGEEQTFTASPVFAHHHITSGSYAAGHTPSYIATPTITSVVSISTTTTSTSTPFVFTKLLKYSMINNDVKELQKFLNTHGYQIAATGAGSAGNETTKFGSLTKAVVMKFQKANNLVPDAIVGAKTNAVLNSLNK